jgi:hypothetical protein
VSFADWVNNGWLVARKSSKQEIGKLLGIVTRDLKDSQAKDVSEAAVVTHTANFGDQGLLASRASRRFWRLLSISF